MQLLKALAWPALAICLAPVSAQAALIPAYICRPARNMPHILRPAPSPRQPEVSRHRIAHLAETKV